MLLLLSMRENFIIIFNVHFCCFLIESASSGKNKNVHLSHCQKKSLQWQTVM